MARPRKKNTKDIRISFRIDPDIKQELDKRVGADPGSDEVSRFLRRLVIISMNGVVVELDPETLQDLARLAGDPRDVPSYVRRLIKSHVAHASVLSS